MEIPFISVCYSDISLILFFFPQFLIGFYIMSSSVLGEVASPLLAQHVHIKQHFRIHKSAQVTLGAVPGSVSGTQGPSKLPSY